MDIAWGKGNLFWEYNHKCGSSEQKSIHMRTAFQIPKNWVADQSIKKLKSHPLVSHKQ